MIKLRPEIEPDMETAKARYPEVLRLILAYTDYIDNHGDEDNSEYERLENTLHTMTGKDMSRYNLWEWWEAEGAEVLAFRIALPDPKSVNNLTKEEVNELVHRMNHFEIPKEPEEPTFENQFKWYLEQYYHAFLKLNHPEY